MKILFHDEENEYAMIETEEDAEKIEERLSHYRVNSPDFNIDDFLFSLENAGFSFQRLPLYADYYIYF